MADPEKELRAICTAADMDYTPEMINYGQKKMETAGLGDPIGVKADSKPNLKSVHKWARNCAHNDERIALLRTMLEPLNDEDLEVFGYTRESLWEPLKDVDEATAIAMQKAAKKWDRYHVERRALLWLRRDIHNRWYAPLLSKMRFYADVLLRE